jgi:uncharacterized membrane protein YbhN (UPF0104 family)
MSWKFKLAISIIVAVIMLIVLAIFLDSIINRIPLWIVIFVGLAFCIYLLLGFIERIPIKQKRQRPRYGI